MLFERLGGLSQKVTTKKIDTGVERLRRTESNSLAATYTPCTCGLFFRGEYWKVQEVLDG